MLRLLTWGCFLPGALVVALVCQPILIAKYLSEPQRPDAE